MASKNEENWLANYEALKAHVLEPDISAISTPDYVTGSSSKESASRQGPCRKNR